MSAPRIGRSVSLDRAAEFLTVSRRTVYNWIRAGRLETIRTPGGSQRVLRASLPGAAPAVRASSGKPVARRREEDVPLPFGQAF